MYDLTKTMDIRTLVDTTPYRSLVSIPSYTRKPRVDPRESLDPSVQTTYWAAALWLQPPPHKLC